MFLMHLLMQLSSVLVHTRELKGECISVCSVFIPHEPQAFIPCGGQEELFTLLPLFLIFSSLHWTTGDWQ